MVRMDFFHALLSKAFISTGARALSSFFLKMGFSGGLALAISYILQAFAEATPFVAYMAPSGAQCDGDKEVTSSSSSGNWRQYLNLPSPKEGDSAPEPSTARAPVREEAHEPSTSSTWSGSWIEKWLNPEVSSSTPNQGQLQQGETGVAPGQPSQVVEQAGPGPAEQQASLFAKQEEMKRELRDFLQAHTKIATKYNLVSQTEEHKTF